jgi:hypothetical protein
MRSRIYVVEQAEVAPRLVKAKTANSAVKFVANTLITARVPSMEEYGTMLVNYGLAVEDATGGEK